MSEALIPAQGPVDVNVRPERMIWNGKLCVTTGGVDGTEWKAKCLPLQTHLLKVKQYLRARNARM